MTTLNAANDNDGLTLNLKTKSRAQLIDISRVVANSLETHFLQNPDSIPYILISGLVGGGKSMIIEAIMKTLLDEYDPDEMKRPNARKQMFIERRPSYALDHYCQAIGHTKGSPVIYGFDRVTDIGGEDAQECLVKSFQKAAQKHETPPIGAIFASHSYIGSSRPWIIINIEGCKKWERDLTISVHNNALTSSLQFRHYWHHLTNFAKTGTLPAEALTAFPEILPRDIFSRNIAYAPNYEVELLKFLFWHHDKLGLNKKQISQIAGNMSDFGNADKVDQFIHWLEDQNENNFVSDIQSSRSKFLRMIFKPVSDGSYNFNAASFVQNVLSKTMKEMPTQLERQKEYRSYFVDQLKSADTEKAQNFRFVLLNYIDEKALTCFLKASTTKTEKIEIDTPVPVPAFQ